MNISEKMRKIFRVLYGGETPPKVFFEEFKNGKMFSADYQKLDNGLIIEKCSGKDENNEKMWLITVIKKTRTGYKRRDDLLTLCTSNQEVDEYIEELKQYK